MQHTTRSAMLLVLGLVACGLVACSGGGGGGGTTGPDPPPNTLAVTNDLGSGGQPRFLPEFGEVALGGTVTWTIRAEAPMTHNVTSDAGAWTKSPELEHEDTFSLTFPRAGVFPYNCTNHPGMIGTITVR